MKFARWLAIEERVQRWVRNDLATVHLTTGFGVLATLLPIVGVLGAQDYVVATRARDIAVRLAPGAAPGRIWRDILGESLRLDGIGAALGLVLAFTLPRVLGAWLPTGLRAEWPAIALASLIGITAAALGGLVPARRAARVDPLALLRAEWGGGPPVNDDGQPRKRLRAPPETIAGTSGNDCGLPRK